MEDCGKQAQGERERLNDSDLREPSAAFTKESMTDHKGVNDIDLAPALEDPVMKNGVHCCSLTTTEVSFGLHLLSLHEETHKV